MKSILSQLAEQNKVLETQEILRTQSEINHPSTKKDRRHFLKKTAIGGISLAGMMGLP
ncbi:MAG: Mandelate racemase/muconate lactonizing protein, partial [Ferruginibacter sp.]|nr:Mandelate racemase/muconate lactonizing protein [Ferruginibacter sp.]